MFANQLMTEFKLLPVVRPVITKWVQKMTEMLIVGLTKDEWLTEIYQLYHYCQRNKLPQFTSFDRPGQFSTTMETWRMSITERGQEETLEHPSLTDLLLDNLNLDPQCENDLQVLEKNLIQQIKAGTKVEYSVAQVRRFCRSHAADKGFYDERGRLDYLVGVWYDIVLESYKPLSPVNLKLEDEKTFHDLMADIQKYVSMEV